MVSHRAFTVAYRGTMPPAQTGMTGQAAERMTRLSPFTQIVGTRVMRLSRVDSPFAGGSDDAILWRFATSTDVSTSITPNASISARGSVAML